jgi:hypothetical protein
VSKSLFKLQHESAFSECLTSLALVARHRIDF